MTQVNPLLDTLTWFQKARPAVSDQDRASQLGVHLEEVVEMLDALGGDGKALPALMNARRNLHELAEGVKNGTYVLRVVDHDLFLDSLCDQNVTGAGVAYTQNYDFHGAMEEVNRSNFSKFDEAGNPIRNEHGKIMKGPNYSKADLSPYLPK
ncbi:MAG: hypothetical protein [Bacteriophage sp.]|nr:MAG: hypothetical protein [Bacteriophage sp.]